MRVDQLSAMVIASAFASYLIVQDIIFCGFHDGLLRYHDMCTPLHCEGVVTSIRGDLSSVPGTIGGAWHEGVSYSFLRWNDVGCFCQAGRLFAKLVHDA